MTFPSSWSSQSKKIGSSIGRGVKTGYKKVATKENGERAMNVAIIAASVTLGLLRAYLNVEAQMPSNSFGNFNQSNGGGGGTNDGGVSSMSDTQTVDTGPGPVESCAIDPILG